MAEPIPTGSPINRVIKIISRVLTIFPAIPIVPRYVFVIEVKKD